MSWNPLDLAGRSLLVTGASSGIGRETAILLSHLGGRVTLVGRNVARLNQVLAELSGEGHRAESFDLAAVEEVSGWLKRLTITSGPLHGLVHCAGVHSRLPLKSLDASKFETVQRVNVTAAAMLAKGFRQKGCCAPNSSIVLLSSVAGLTGQAGISAYSTSKAAVAGLTRCLAIELARERIRVNCVAPGMVRTEMTEKFFESLSAEQVQGIEALHPLGFGTARDVANAIAFLISDASRWITGSTLVVDGGYTAQ